MTDANYPIDGSRDALWMATAVAAPITRKLTHSAHYDVTIVGAGFTGLNAALRLASRGVSVCVIEAGILGQGSSGRSGGQVNLGLNETPPALLRRYGRRRAERLVDAIVNTPSRVFETIATHGLRCDPVRRGWIQAAPTERKRRALSDLAHDYVPYGVNFEELDGEELRIRSGAHGYAGGLFLENAGSLQPLSYTRELARVAMEQGADIFTGSRVSGLCQRSKGWRLTTDEGRIDSDSVLLCTNAYTDSLVSGLARKVVPVRTILTATEPLPTSVREAVLPNEVTLVDKRALILYFRYDRDGRLCAGFHGPMRDSFRLDDFDELKRRTCQIFPNLASIHWDYHWGGRVAVTKNGLPFLYRPAPGLMAGMGYNGRGVGTGTVMGQVLADAVLGQPDDELAFPVEAPAEFVLHRFHRAGASMAIQWYALQDHLSERQARSER